MAPDAQATAAPSMMTPKKLSIWSSLPSWRASWPGLLAMVIISIICGLPGVDFPFTLEKLLSYIDSVLPPIYGKGLFVDLLHFNYVVIGLVAGMFIRNVVGVPKSWEAGLSYSAVFMNVGIIMLGSQYMLRDLVKLGAVSVLLMIVMVFGGAIIFIVLGRFFKLGTALNALLAGAFSMCGVSACVAIAPMVKAKSDEVAYAIAVSVTFGLLCLFALPFLGRLVGLSNYAFGIMAAAGVPNSNQVIATGFNFSFEAGKVAGFSNIGRVVLIPAGVLFIYFMTLTKELATSTSKINIWQVLKEKFPLFVIGFVFVWGLNCLHMWPQPANEAMEKVLNWSFTLCFVGLGLQTKLSDLKNAGPKGLILGYIAGSLRVGICLAIIIVLLKLGVFK
jgi:uncharacterized integral membrane protein (TIGR00698 family)